MKRLILLLFLTSLCFGETAVINSFSAGELSPLLEGRTDVKKYYSGCRTLENMCVLPHGGVTKRPGTYYVAPAKNSDAACRLIPFEYSVTQAYIIEMGDHYLRFYKDGGQITSGGAPVEIATPYTTSEIFEVQYVQSADTMYFVHPSHKPRKLTRTSHTNWTLSIIDFKRGPFLDPYDCDQVNINVASANIASSANGSTASETGTVSGSTTYGAVSSTNDDNRATYWSRRQQTSSGNITLIAQFTIEISLGVALEQLDSIVAVTLLDYYTVAGYNFNHTKSVTCSIKQGGTWTEVGGGLGSPFTINGPWPDVTDIKVELYYLIRGYQMSGYTWVGATLYELEAYGVAAQEESCTTITPSNTQNYDRVLDNGQSTSDQGDNVRFPCTGHGFLKNDYVTITGCDNDGYNGTHQIVNVSDVDHFDIYCPTHVSETFDGDEEVISRVELTASADLWNANHVGALWQITHTMKAEEVSGTFSGNTSSTTQTMQLNRSYDFNLDGLWTGTVLLQRSYDSGGTWKDVYSYTKLSTGQPGLSYSDSETVEDASYKVTMTNWGAGGTGCQYSLLARSYDLDGVAEITSYVDAKHVRAKVKYALGGITATDDWAEGAWSEDEGYPSCITFYEERQVFAASTNSAQTIWMSQTDDWDNFLIGSMATDAITLTIAADQVNSVRWMVPQTALLVGTAGAEWKIGVTNVDEPLKPDNINAKKQSNYGSANLQAVSVGNTIIFLQKNAQKLRKLVYSFELDNWVAPDLTLLSEHITGDGIVDLAYQKNPYPILWCVRSDGDVTALTMEENQEVLGWSRHKFDGDVESIAVIPGTKEDEIWISVERVIDSNTYRYIEQIQPFDWGTDQEDCFFVDSGLTFDSGSAVAVTGITQANPGVVTAAAHGFSDGEQVRFYDVNGMTYVNNKVYTVSNPSTNTFELRDKLDVSDIDTRGTVAHWKMDDNASNTIVEDVYGHDGTSVMNTEDMTIDGKIGSSLKFVGKIDLITVSDNNDFSFVNGSSDCPFSISVWFYTGQTIDYLIVKKDSEWAIITSEAGGEGKVVFTLRGGGTIFATLNDYLSSNQWHFATATYDGSGAKEGLKIYINGTLSDFTLEEWSTYNGMSNTTNNVIFGRSAPSFVIPDGRIDDVRIFNKKLNKAEITRLYNIGEGNEKPIGYCQYIDGGYVRKCENTFTTLGHLEGETVAVLQDGGDAGTKTVSLGTITLDDYYYVVHAGLPYTAKILPMKLEMVGSPGALFGQTKRITDVTLRFHKTSGCRVGPSWTDYESMIFRKVLDPLDEPTPLYSDDKSILFSGPFEKAGNIYIQNNLPLPFTVLAMMCKFEVEDIVR